MRAHSSAPASSHAGETYLEKRSSICEDTQVRPCTPLVTEPIGTSSAGTGGHRAWNISRLVWPCSLATPLDMPARRRPMTAMLNGASAGLAGEVAEGHQGVDATLALLGPAPEVPLHQLPREAVDAGRDRGVGGEDGAGPDRLDGLGPAAARRSVISLRIRSRPEEAGVALVGVEDLGLGADGVEGPHAADAEQDLLADPVLGAAAVEAVGDGPQVVVVGVDVGVEQVELDPADLGQPDLGLERLRRPGRRETAMPVDQLRAMLWGSSTG